MSNYEKVSAILIRKKNKKQGPSKSKNIYPCYPKSTCKESYNYENIRESVYGWNDYSSYIASNWKQLMHLYEATALYGTPSQLHELTDIINTDILPYIESPSMLKGDIHNRMLESTSDDEKCCLHSMIDVINEEIECDRTLNNFDIISKRFDINKLVRGSILYEDAVTETLYSLCSLIDTYDMDFKSKFAIACEAALYSVFNAVGDEILEDTRLRKKLTNVNILENVTDYFMINYGLNNMEKFIDIIEETAHKDIFIGDQLDGYMSHLRKVNGNRYTEEMVNEAMQPLDDSKDIQRKFIDESVLGLAKDLDQYDIMRKSAERMVYSEDTIDDIKEKANEFITKVKMLPTQSVASVKSAIAAIMVPCRMEDISAGTHNSLAIVFYVACTLGWFVLGGALIGMLGMIVTYIISKATQKVYLKDAIQEWREHKYGVERKIKECEDPEKKKRMEAYLEQIEIDIEKLENHYNKMRDSTIEELNDKSDRRMASPDYHKTSQINPQGYITPTSELFKKDGNSHQMVKLKQDNAEQEEE